jgi:hypothetical protein
MMTTFLHQRGYPLVKVTRDKSSRQRLIVNQIDYYTVTDIRRHARHHHQHRYYDDVRKPYMSTRKRRMKRSMDVYSRHVEDERDVQPQTWTIPIFLRDKLNNQTKLFWLMKNQTLYMNIPYSNKNSNRWQDYYEVVNDNLCYLINIE